MHYNPSRYFCMHHQPVAVGIKPKVVEGVGNTCVSCIKLTQKMLFISNLGFFPFGYERIQRWKSEL